MKRNKIWNWVGISMSSIFNLKNYFSLLLYSFHSWWCCWWSHRWMRKWGSEINKLSKNSFSFFCSDHRWAAVDFLIVHTLDDDLFYYYFYILVNTKEASKLLFLFTTCKLASRHYTQLFSLMTLSIFSSFSFPYDDHHHDHFFSLILKYEKFRMLIGAALLEF